jgi:hypothetical protein
MKTVLRVSVSDEIDPCFSFIAKRHFTLQDCKV